MYGCGGRGGVGAGGWVEVLGGTAGGGRGCGGGGGHVIIATSLGLVVSNRGLWGGATMG